MKITPLFAATLAVATLGSGVATPARAQTAQADARFAQAQARFDREYQLYREEADRYRAARTGAAYREPAYDNGGYQQADPRDPYAASDGRRVAPDIYSNGTYRDDRDEGNYDPSRYYRPGQETVLSANDRVYAGQNGQYYCKRPDGTTGLIVGAAGGGILGNVIDGGHSRTVGTLLGAAIGGLAGRAVDQNNSQVRCR